MMQHGVGGNQVTQVRGFADQRLRKKEEPLDPSNRRISLIVQYIENKKSAPGPPADADGVTNPSEGTAKPGAIPAISAATSESHDKE